MYLSLKKGTILYRGINDLNNINITGIPLWLSLDKTDAMLYGNIIMEYELLRDINLLNIMNLDFHNNYLNILNLIYTGIKYDGVDDRKIEASIPIGLPDYDTQYNYLFSKGVELKNTPNWLLEHDRAVKFLLNRHRYSIFERDKLLVKTLILIYGNKCDGYISQIKWPSKFHDGFFNKEICLFNPTSDLLKHKPKGGNKKKIIKNKGGAYDIPKGDSWNRMNKKMDLSDIDETKLFKDTNIKFVLENLDNLVPNHYTQKI
jgi:hypothetical protein